MHYTIFKTPIIRPIMRAISIVGLRLCGWKLQGDVPTLKKYVLIAAPHTSNWDFPFALMVCFAMRLDVYWMGKASLFPPVLGAVMKWLGGIPVDRARSNNLVQGTIDEFLNSDQLVVIVPPEGTRGKVTRWKTGFYHIAHGASVPIVCGFLDFKLKIGGVGPVFYTTGNIEEDMLKLRAFYAGITGKHPQSFDVESISVNTNKD
jgi:1-acyl-sn-glycerol-3-phosphate acyltransferase